MLGRKEEHNRNRRQEEKAYKQKNMKKNMRENRPKNQ